jgi:hypothetical protein
MIRGSGIFEFDISVRVVSSEFESGESLKLKKRRDEIREKASP